MDITIREAAREDAEVVVHIVRSSFRDVAERFNLDRENAPTHPSNCQPDWIRSDLNRGVFYYLLYAQGAAAGCGRARSLSLRLAAQATGRGRW